MKNVEQKVQPVRNWLLKILQEQNQEENEVYMEKQEEYNRRQK